MKNKTNKLAKLLLTAVIAVTVFASTPAFASEITNENVLYLINKERAYYGLDPLEENSDLDMAATNKSKDMVNKNYFEHYAFNMTPWDFIKNSGYNYLYAGENLAMNFQSAEGMINAWMKSSSHRKNILSEDYNEAGIGIVKGEYTDDGQVRETYMVTNMFGRKKPFIVEVFNNIVETISYLFSW